VIVLLASDPAEPESRKSAAGAAHSS
jgi:hypothetical protein